MKPCANFFISLVLILPFLLINLMAILTNFNNNLETHIQVKKFIYIKQYKNFFFGCISNENWFFRNFQLGLLMALKNNVFHWKFFHRTYICLYISSTLVKIRLDFVAKVINHWDRKILSNKLQPLLLNK